MSEKKRVLRIANLGGKVERTQPVKKIPAPPASNTVPAPPTWEDMFPKKGGK